MEKNISPQSIMLEFAVATGLTDASREPRRYLWTDAFAVCNYLALYRQNNEPSYLQFALKLVDQVHQTLGKQRKDSGRSGWLSGLDDKRARQHPTLGGLRIGKKLNERQPGEPADQSLEWDQDGQYFHYLTKWMHALNRVSQVTGNSIYNQWARELARVAHAAFTYAPSPLKQMGGIKRMFWKMSIDLSHPLVDSMGYHDPIDGLLTYLELEATVEQFSESSSEFSLKAEIKEMQTMCAGKHWVCEDALGIGGLLSDAFTLVELINTHHLQETARLESLLQDIALSLEGFMTQNQLNLPAEYRLAFRELGLSIGLHTIVKLQHIIEKNPDNFENADQLVSTLGNLYHFHKIAALIESYWLKPKHRSVNSWQEHQDINNVMLATSLLMTRIPHS